jgi:hypothetical protein
MAFEIVSFIKKRPKHSQEKYPTVIFSHSTSTKTWRRPKNRRLSLFLKVFDKNLSPFHRRAVSMLFFALIVFKLTLPMIFLPVVSKVTGRC